MKQIYLAGGCFWGVQKFFNQFKGILKSEVGYANGDSERPTYNEVCNGSGHCEVVYLQYDESHISLKRIIELFFKIIDPTSLNRQGFDYGIQYRSGIYYVEAGDAEIIKEVYNALEAQSEQKFVVELKKLENYYPAEEYHQQYLDKNPGGYCHLPWQLLHLAEIKGEKEDEEEVEICL